MFSKRITLTALLALTVLLTAASSVLTQQSSEMLREEFHQTYPLAADGRVSLENINGAVHVTAWDRNEVKVDAVKSAYRRERLDEAKIEVQSEANSDVGLLPLETAISNRLTWVLKLTSWSPMMNRPIVSL